jgi:DNA-directed RNA polymerase specialized sigma24 family protein
MAVQAIPSEDQLWELMRLVQSRAAQMGLTREESEDCASHFILSVIEGKREVLRADLPPEAKRAWSIRCATHFCIDYLRQIRRRDSLVRPFVEGEVEQLSQDQQQQHDPCLSSVLYRLFLQQLDMALKHLPSCHREILLPLIAEEEKPTDAHRQRLYRARKQLSATLKRMGVIESE